MKKTPLEQLTEEMVLFSQRQTASMYYVRVGIEHGQIYIKFPQEAATNFVEDLKRLENALVESHVIYEMDRFNSRCLVGLMQSICDVITLKAGPSEEVKFALPVGPPLFMDRRG